MDTQTTSDYLKKIDEDLIPACPECKPTDERHFNDCPVVSPPEGDHHQHSFAMCTHDNEDWHAACVHDNCPEDHYAFGLLAPICCSLCGSQDHFPIDCPGNRLI